MERLLLIAGIAALAWCAVRLTDTLIAQRIARSSLEVATVVENPVRAAAAATPVDPGSAGPPARGSAVGTLTIPRVDLSAVVLHGSDDQTLRRGPGHLENTPLPGESGNVVIAGHRDTFFRPLRNIQLGDDIFIETPAGRFRYQVASVRVVSPRDLRVLRATDDSVLTLITCYPFWVLGNAPERFVVRATAVSGPAAAITTPDASTGAPTAVAPG
jgi:sortase A